MRHNAVNEGENMANERTKHATRNMAFGFANKLVTIVLNFIGRAIFVRILAPEYLGITGLFGDILIMLSLADLGLGTAIAYSFYQPLADNDEKKIAGLITFYGKVYSYIAIAVSIIGISLVPFLNNLVKLDHPIPNLHIYYLITLLDTVISYLFVYKSIIITADQKEYEITKIRMVANVVKLLSQMIGLIVTHSYLIYISLGVITTISLNLYLSRKAEILYPYIKNKEELATNEKKKIFANMKAAFVYNVSYVMLSGSDNIIISVFVGTVYVGMYSNYNMITSNLYNISNIVFGSLTASLGNLIVSENSEKQYNTYRIMQMVSFWFSGVFAICLFFLTDDFVKLWVGSDYRLNNMALIAILLNFYLTISLLPIWTIRSATGLYRKIKYVMLTTAIMNLILSIIGAKFFGVAGVLGATFVSKISTYFWYEPGLIYKNYFNRNVAEYYINHLINGVIVVVGIGVMSIIFNSVKSDSYLFWILKAAIIFIFANAIYIIRYYKAAEFKEIKQRAIKFIHK